MNYSMNYEASKDPQQTLASFRKPIHPIVKKKSKSRQHEWTKIKDQDENKV
jgi:hypothetical protein